MVTSTETEKDRQRDCKRDGERGRERERENERERKKEKGRCRHPALRPAAARGRRLHATRDKIIFLLLIYHGVTKQQPIPFQP